MQENIDLCTGVYGMFCFFYLLYNDVVYSHQNYWNWNVSFYSYKNIQKRIHLVHQKRCVTKRRQAAVAVDVSRNAPFRIEMYCGIWDRWVVEFDTLLYCQRKSISEEAASGSVVVFAVTEAG